MVWKAVAAVARGCDDVTIHSTVGTEGGILWECVEVTDILCPGKQETVIGYYLKRKH